jgi:hypothetical protein
MASERDEAITRDVAAIRTAVYGVEVREAIADGIEQCHEDSKSAATTEDVNTIVDKYLTASFSKTYATTEANQQISLNFDLYAVAGSTITIEQTAGSVVAGSQYTVTTTPAKTGETSMSYGGVVQTTQQFKYSFTTSVDLQKVNLVAIVNAPAVHAFKITYLPGASQIANEKPSLTLYEGHNAVTMTAAQLRQLLALLN